MGLAWRCLGKAARWPTWVRRRAWLTIGYGREDSDMRQCGSGSLGGPCLNIPAGRLEGCHGFLWVSGTHCCLGGHKDLGW